MYHAYFIETIQKMYFFIHILYLRKKKMNSKFLLLKIIIILVALLIQVYIYN